MAKGHLKRRMKFKKRRHSYHPETPVTEAPEAPEAQAPVKNKSAKKKPGRPKKKKTDV